MALVSLHAVAICTLLMAQIGDGGGHEIPVAERITRAETALESLDFEEAASELMVALGDARATEEELLHATLLAGITNRVLDRNVEARMNFHYVLTRAPDTKLAPDTSPKIGTFFELVRREVKAENARRYQPPQGGAAAPGLPPPPSTTVDESEGLGTLFWSGAGLVGLSAALGASLVVGVGVAELAVRNPDRAWSDKSGWMLAGRVALVSLSVPTVGAVVGGGLLGWGALE